MAATDGKELLARYVRDVWEQGDLDALRRHLAPGFRRHLSPRSEPLGLEEQIERLRGLRRAIPDITITVEDVVAEDDRVAFRSVLRGTHQGDLLGIPASGRSVEVALVDVIRVEDGRIVEQWGGPDMLDLLRQIGGVVSAG